MIKYLKSFLYCPFVHVRQKQKIMFKVVFKTAVKAIIGIAILALIVFGVLSLGFPSTMAGLCENTGNFYMAAGYASLSYTYTGDVNDLNRCFADNVQAKNDGDIVRFGEKLVQDEKFGEVCETNSKTVTTENGKVFIDYKQFVYGNIACAKYRLGDKDEAVSATKTAMDGVENFPKNNAVAYLSLQVIESGDKGTAEKLLAEMEKFKPAEDETGYYNTLKSELQKVGGEEL